MISGGERHNLHENWVKEKYVYDNEENTSDDMEYVSKDNNFTKNKLDDKIK